MALKTKLTEEKASALISVLCFIAVASLLAASAVSLSIIAGQSSAVFADRSKAAYIAEGAASRTIWLLMNDLGQFPDRASGNLDYSKVIGDRYMADGYVHNMEYYDYFAEASIYDMARGIDISSNASGIQALFTDADKKKSTQDNEELKNFLNKIEDYIDADDFLRPNGAEKQDYVKLGLPSLPRNATMKFKEEILYIPGFEDLFQISDNGRLDIFRGIPPVGLPQSPGLPSFFNADKQLIKNLCKFNDDQIDTIVKARQQCFEKGVPLSQLLTPEQMAKLMAKFSFRESGFYTIDIKASSDKGKYGRNLVISLKIDKNLSYNTLPYYEWMLY